MTAEMEQTMVTRTVKASPKRMKPEDRRAAPGAVERRSIESPFGLLTLFAEDEKLTRLVWAIGRKRRNARPGPLLAEAERQLAAYFSGRLTSFDLPLAPEGSPFAGKVWGLMQQIPHGETRSYGSLARALNSSARAVGRACGANPLPILVPCHRVVGAGGRLCGYSGQGGIATKARLLALEQGS